MEGYVKLYRRLKEWKWYGDPPTKDVFIHCLITANYQDTQWKDRIIPAGSLIIGVEKLGEELGYSRQQIRRAIFNLQTTNEITIETTSRYTQINVVNWAKYQLALSDDNQQNIQQENKNSTNGQPSNNHQTTTSKELKELKKERIKEEVLKRDTGTVVPSVAVSTPKSRYGEFKHVLLTEKQFNKLHVDFPNADELITFLDEYIQMKGYKATDHNLAIRKWVVNAVNEEKLKKRNNLPVKETLQEEIDRRVKAVQKIMGVEGQ